MLKTTPLYQSVVCFHFLLTELPHAHLSLQKGLYNEYLTVQLQLRRSRFSGLHIVHIHYHHNHQTSPYWKTYWEFFSLFYHLDKLSHSAEHKMLIAEHLHFVAPLTCSGFSLKTTDSGGTFFLHINSLPLEHIHLYYFTVSDEVSIAHCRLILSSLAVKSPKIINKNHETLEMMAKGLLQGFNRWQTIKLGHFWSHFRHTTYLLRLMSFDVS